VTVRRHKVLGNLAGKDLEAASDQWSPPTHYPERTV